MGERVVLITGCRSGFGLLAAVAAARAGYTVYAGLRDLSTGAALEQAAAGLDVRPLQLDVTDADQREAAVAAILGAHGRLDGLVNNAGRALGGFLEQLDPDELRELLEVNVVAVHALTNLVLPAMRAAGAGVIVNVSSVSGRVAMPGLGAYAASKFALEGMSEALRHELRPFGVRVILLEPGPYRTDIFGRNRAEGRRARDPDSPYAARAARLAALVDRAEAGAGDPAEVAARIVACLDGRATRLRQPLGRLSGLRIALKERLPFAGWEAVVGRVVGG